MSKLTESAFGLDAWELEQIHYLEVLKKRGMQRKSGRSGSRPSDLMSPEAQIAMQLALEDTIALKQDLDKRRPNGIKKQAKPLTRVAFAEDMNMGKKTSPSAEANQFMHSNLQRTREPSFSELYERKGSARMRQDLTDESYSEGSEPKKALGGGKVESAMEIIEIVNKDDPSETILDEQAIEELARINAVDKCAVWIEATQSHQSKTTLTKPQGTSTTSRSEAS